VDAILEATVQVLLDAGMERLTFDPMTISKGTVAKWC